MQVQEINDKDRWSRLIEAHGCHPLQAWQWGELKSSTGPWTASRLVCVEDDDVVGIAQVLTRKIPFPFRFICYIPRGPWSKDESRFGEVADACATWCESTFHPVSLKIEPALTDADLSANWSHGQRVLLGLTAVLDLQQDEESIFSQLPSKKARQYIRKAKRDGVTVREAAASDLEGLLHVYHKTAEHDNFAIHADEFYAKAFETLCGLQQLFVAEKDGELLAFLWNVTTSGAAFELWGGVSGKGKQLRANYLLKWEAIKQAKRRGAALYDLNGLLNDGISEFKRRFSREQVRWTGTWERPLSPLYGAWNAGLKLYQRQLKSFSDEEVNGQQGTDAFVKEQLEEAQSRIVVNEGHLREVLARRTGTCAHDWYLVFKARYAMELVFETLRELRGDGAVATQLFTCVTAIDPILKAGLVPKYLDIDPSNLMIDQRALEAAESVYAIVMQHSFGIIDNSASRRLAECAHEKEALLVEDCAHCVCRFARDEEGKPLADVSIHSFGVQKMLPTNFGGAIWINPSLRKGEGIPAEFSLRLRRKLEALPNLDSKLDVAARSYLNQNRILNRLPESSSTSMRRRWVEKGKIELPVSQAEQSGDLPLRAQRPSAWVNDKAIAALNDIDANEQARVASVSCYDAFFSQNHQFAVPEGARAMPPQPLMRYPILAKSTAEADKRISELRQRGVYAEKWGRPLLYPGIINRTPYKLPACLEEEAPASLDISKRIICLPTELTGQQMSAVFELLRSHSAETEAQEAYCPITDEKEIPGRLVPVILGGDILAYSYVRCFYSAYGIRPIVLSAIDHKITSSSKLCDYRVVQNFLNEDELLRYICDLGRQLVARGKVGLLLGSSDWQARLLSKNKGLLSRWYKVPYIDFDLLDRITQKEEFYSICDELGIAHPKTWLVDCSSDAQEEPLDFSQLSYPLIAKPSNSAAYDLIDFEGRQKIYKIDSEARLRQVIKMLRQSAYGHKLVVQDYIPGSDQGIRSLTAYCDTEGRICVVSGGRVILQDHDPQAIGNPVVIQSERIEQIIRDAEKFLVHVSYHGFANFDIKFDPRDGHYKFFEINTRPGRNTYYMSLGGVNFVEPLVNDCVLGRRLERKEAYQPFVYSLVPSAVVRDHVDDSALRQQLLGQYASGLARSPLDNPDDGLLHACWAHAYKLRQIQKFNKFMGQGR